MHRILIAALAALIATPSIAADYRPGPYAGATIGYAAGSLTNSTGDLTTDGVPVSGIVGYTHAIAGTPMVIGIEGEATWANVKGEQAAGAFTLEASSDYSLAVKARVGWSAGPALLYLTAGPNWTNSKLEIAGLKDSNLTLGAIAGAGVDLQLTNTIAVRLEAVRMMDFGQEWTLGVGAPVKLDAGETQIRLGVIINVQ